MKGAEGCSSHLHQLNYTPRQFFISRADDFKRMRWLHRAWLAFGLTRPWPRSLQSQCKQEQDQANPQRNFFVEPSQGFFFGENAPCVLQPAVPCLRCSRFNQTQFDGARFSTKKYATEARPRRQAVESAKAGPHPFRNRNRVGLQDSPAQHVPALRRQTAQVRRAPPQPPAVRGARRRALRAHAGVFAKKCQRDAFTRKGRQLQRPASWRLL